MTKVRINRYLASTGAISRRKADDLIIQGRVKINNKKAILGDTLDPDQDVVTLDGNTVTRQNTLLVAMYKPKFVLTTMNDPQGRPCIKDLIPKQLQGVFPVGRLDFDAEGLLILTNDGDLSHSLHHPSFHVPKVYLVNVSPKATPEAMKQIETGIFLDGRKTLPAKVTEEHAGPEGSALRITLVQGLKNQIKRMAMAVGLRVESIKRISIGPVMLKGMSPGQIRQMSQSEEGALYKILKKHKKP
jgi:23S rRNA pseudouridine2605 synthase